MSKTAEYALSRMTASMGQAERNEQLSKMRAACSDKDLRDIVSDHRTSVFGPTAGQSTVVPSGAGRVTTPGWYEPPPLGARDWCSMSEGERKLRDEEWARDYAARKAAQKDQSDKG
jgi:hypothetical protein